MIAEEIAKSMGTATEPFSVLGAEKYPKSPQDAHSDDQLSS